jgi:hypothetical protein
MAVTEAKEEGAVVDTEVEPVVHLELLWYAVFIIHSFMYSI